MKGYLITFNRESKGNYKLLEEEIKNTFKWWTYLENTWIIITNETANEIWERLEKYFPKEGNILIIEVVSNCQGWLPKDAWEWIEENLEK